MTQRGTPPEMLRGVVEATNERGIKLNGRWLNYSQFRQVARAETGQEVEVEVVRDRFINALSVVGGSATGGDVTLELDDDPMGDETFGGLDVAPFPLPGAPPSPAPAPSPGARPRPAQPFAPPAPSWSGPRPADRNTEIRRLALIKAAADYAAARPKLTPEDVLEVARGWEAWIVEPEGEREAGRSGERGAERSGDGERSGDSADGDEG